VTAGGETEIFTFVVAEVRGSSPLIIEKRAVAVAKLAAKFALLTRSVVAARGGTVIDLRDGRAVAMFPSPRHGLLAAADLQNRFARASLSDESCPLTVGIGVQPGVAVPFAGEYRGPAISLAARLCRLAGPGEVLTTDGMVDSARELDGFEYLNRGSSQLRGLANPVNIVEVLSSGSPSIIGEGRERITADDERASREARLSIGGFLGALPAGLIVGREHELSRILAGLDGVIGGTGQLSLLSGEAGVGKTRLAQEVHLTARNHGFLVAAGRCYEPQQANAFYPFVDALASLFTVSPASVRDEAAKRWPYLGQLLPDQIGTYPLASADPDDQQRLFHAVTGFLQSIAEWTPVALLLDDLHWADSSSLALLQHLSRQTRGDRVFLLGAYRDVDVGSAHPLKGALRDLNREGLVSSFELRRLGTDATSALVAAVLGEESVSEEFTQLIQSRTEGNPYFVGQVMRAMVERGDIYWKDGTWDRKGLEQIDVPETVRSVVGQRVSRLSGETQIVLHEASVLGQTFHFDDLEAMSRRTEQALDVALEEAALVGLVRVMGGDRYIFDHALTHQTLYDELSPRRRRNLHRAAGAALEELPRVGWEKRVVELAHHFFQGHDSPKALLWSMLAGDQAEAVFAHADAELHYSTALHLASELDDLKGKAEALEKLGRVYRLSARYVEALDTLERAAASYRDLGEMRGTARTVGQIGRVYFDEGLTEEGVTRIKPLLAQLEKSEPGTELDPVVAELAIVMAHLLWRGGTYLDSASVAARGADRARRAGDAGLLAEAEFRRGMALSNSGDFGQGFRVMEDAISLAEAAGDVDTASRAVGNLALFHWDRGETSQARALLARSLELCRKTNDPTKIADKLGDLAVADFTQGEWDSARAHLDSAERILRGVPSSWIRSHNTMRSGELNLALGNVQEGLSMVQDGRDMAERDGNMLAECEAAYVLSDHALFSGDRESALSHLEHFLARHAVERDAPEALQTWGLALFARLFAELGDIARALDYLSRVSDEQIVAHLDSVYSVRAVVAAHEGKWDEAEQHAEEALAFARRGGFIVSEARLRYFWGLWLARKGDTQRARDRLTKSLSIFRQLGAQPYVERVEQLLLAYADGNGEPIPGSP
jgi:tetratricopeptide (TPR) repeat protein